MTEKILKACADIFCGDDCLSKYEQLLETNPDLSERGYSKWMIEQHKSMLEVMIQDSLSKADVKRLADNLRKKMQYAKSTTGENLPLSAPILTESDQRFILKEAKDIKRERRNERKQQREEQIAETIEKDPPLEGEKYRLIYGDFQKSDIEPESIDAIITDPPYGFEYLSLYKDLSGFANRVLKPNAPCLVMTGQSWLETVLNLLSSDLNYVWTLAYFSPGKSTQIFSRKIKSNWKPVIFLVNGKNECEHIEDWVNAGKYDKDYHDWGQTVEGMIQIIERFTFKGQIILDPFCGAGSTGIGALQTDRHFIGIDNNEYAIKQSGERLKEIVTGRDL